MSLWKRGFLEILSEILGCLVNGPMKKTHIISKCKLDSRTASRYLSLMQKIGLVEKSKNPWLFEVTQKGIDLFYQYELIVNMIEDDLKMTNQVIEKNKKTEPPTRNERNIY